MNEIINIGYVTNKVKIRRTLWKLVWFVLFRPFGTKLFRLWRIALLRLFGAKIDWTAEVYASADIWAPWMLTMEARSCLGPHAIIYNQARVTVEADAVLSQYAYVCTAGHETGDVNNASSGLLVSAVKVEKNAWVGTRAFIGMGVTIGESAIVGACACVFKNVQSRTVVGGNPAVIIKEL